MRARPGKRNDSYGSPRTNRPHSVRMTTLTPIDLRHRRLATSRGSTRCSPRCSPLTRASTNAASMGGQHSIWPVSLDDRKWPRRSSTTARSSRRSPTTAPGHATVCSIGRCRRPVTHRTPHRARRRRQRPRDARSRAASSRRVARRARCDRDAVARGRRSDRGNGRRRHARRNGGVARARSGGSVAQFNHGGSLIVPPALHHVPRRPPFFA
jgi:hypothetical protein